MEVHADNLLATALSLPVGERAQLAASLLQSLDSTDAEYDSAWALEIERRVREIDAGRVTLIPWEQVIQSMRERLNG
jgi:putative addiction module component (TIGR02574 family)